MSESIARVGEIDICYETFGDASDPAILLIMGLGTQMLAWHEDFCEQLAGRGYFVIRHDNRDIGRSSRLDSAPVPTLKQLAAYPIVTYVFSFTGPSSLQQMFAKAGLTLNVALTARDSDVIKTYVRLGLGVGIVADVAVDPREDRDLVAIDASHLFSIHTTWIGFSRGGLLRRYMYEFMQLFAPHLTRRIVDRAMAADSQEELAGLFADVKLPLK